MNIAELFVTIGAKGADKTVGALTGVQKGMKETASMSLEAKAAILGAMYATQQFFARSGQAGTNLTNFNSLLGVSAHTLQQYQYAARQAGVSNQEVEGTFKALQTTMTKTLMGQGAPSGLARVADITGGISAEDVKRFAEKPQELIQRLQEYARKETNTGLRNEVLRSFGVGDNMISAFNRQAFAPQNLNKAPTYSESEIAQLDRANIAWSNLSNKIEMAIGHLNALHGGELVADFSMLTDRVLTLVEAFVKLADKLKVFQVLGKVFEGWGMIFDTISEGVDSVNKVDPKSGKSASLTEGVSNFFLKDVPNVFGPMLKDMFDTNLKGADVIPKDKMGTPEKPVTTQPQTTAQGAVPMTHKVRVEHLPKRNNKLNAPNKPALRLVAPPMPNAPLKPDIAPNVPGVLPQANNNNNQNIEVNQTLNFQGHTEPKQNADAMNKAVRNAFRQLSSQIQGS